MYRIEVTDVKIRRIKGKARLKGIASITINEKLIINDIRIILTERGYEIAFPAHRLPSNGHRVSQVVPSTNQLRKYIQHTILERFFKLERRESNEV